MSAIHHVRGRVQKKRFIIYVDASTTDRGLCGILVPVDAMCDERIKFFEYRVPDSWDLNLLDRETQICLLETVTVNMCLATWHSELKNSEVDIFCDNEGSVNALIRGYSKQSDICCLVGCAWLRLLLIRCDVHFWRVTSQSNPADGGSHFLKDPMFQRLYARWKRVKGCVPHEISLDRRIDFDMIPRIWSEIQQL